MTNQIFQLLIIYFILFIIPVIAFMLSKTKREIQNLIIGILLNDDVYKELSKVSDLK